MSRRPSNVCLKFRSFLSRLQKNLKKIFALTYQEAFFTRLGFRVVDKSVLPQKIWADCVHCAKYPDCDETAVFLEVPDAPETTAGE